MNDKIESLGRFQDFKSLMMVMSNLNFFLTVHEKSPKVCLSIWDCQSNFHHAFD